MITAVVNIDLYRYEIHSLLKAFYPRSDVKVYAGEADEKKENRRESGTEEKTASGNEADRFRCLVVFSAARIDISFISADRDEVKCSAGPAPEGISFCEKSNETKTALKHLLYEMLSRRSGRELPWGELIGVRPTKIAEKRLELGATVEEAAAFMSGHHLVSAEKALISAQIAERERKIFSSLHGTDGFSLYIGIPFCPSTCLYCSFTSFPIASYAERVDEYLSALEKEMCAVAQIMKEQGKILDTIYVGGGTPTTLTPAQFHRLLGSIERNFDLSQLKEFTVEAGRPDSITAEKLRALREHGVGRISVNPQTMNDETLRLIGRRHSADDVRKAYALAREEGFDNINMDLILGLPGEGEKEVEYTIREIEKMRPDDLTVHSLALKRGSRMQEWIARNGFDMINNTDSMMKIAAQGAARMGLVPYYLYRQKNMSGNFENTGYAREGAFGIYNILIMEEIQSIAAIGAGSISKRVFSCGRLERRDNVREVDLYISQIDEMTERKRILFGENE